MPIRLVGSVAIRKQRQRKTPEEDLLRGFFFSACLFASIAYELSGWNTQLFWTSGHGDTIDVIHVMNRDISESRPS
jgi:hypothetical protein